MFAVLLQSADSKLLNFYLV